jgi:hypothetical protein
MRADQGTARQVEDATSQYSQQALVCALESGVTAECNPEKVVCHPETTLKTIPECIVNNPEYTAAQVSILCSFRSAIAETSSE